MILILEDILPGLLDTAHDGWGQHWQVALGPILILVVLFARGGVAGLIETNQAVMFVRTFNSWHSVRPMLGTGSPAMRRSLTINIEEH